MYSWRIPSHAVFCSGIMGQHLILPVGDALGAQKNSASVSFFLSFVRRCTGVKQETSAPEHCKMKQNRTAEEGVAGTRETPKPKQTYEQGAVRLLN